MNKYHMRRQDREIKDESVIEDILTNGKYLTLALTKENEPYAVALSYGYDKNHNVLYLHCAKEGQKVDFIKANPKASAVIIEDNGYIQGECGHNYRSVVIKGNITIVQDISEKIYGMETILAHLENIPSVIKERSLKNNEVYNNILILRLDIKSITGKQGR